MVKRLILLCGAVIAVAVFVLVSGNRGSDEAYVTLSAVVDVPEAGMEVPLSYSLHPCADGYELRRVGSKEGIFRTADIDEAIAFAEKDARETAYRIANVLPASVKESN